MKKAVHILAGLACVLLSTAGGLRAHAQAEPGLDPAKALTQYLHQSWTTDEGLPQNTVSAVTETRDGYLWLGTEEGLVRYDGMSFTVFDKNNTAAFEEGQAVEALLEDRRGALWIGTSGGGLIRYADSRFTRFTEQDGLTSRTVSALGQDAAGRLWIGTWDAGLFAFADGRFTNYTTEDGLTNDFVTALYLDGQGRLWVGTREGLNRVEGDTFIAYDNADGSRSDFVLALREDRDGVLWVGTRDGLSRIQDGKLQPYASGEAWSLGGVRALAAAAGGLWIGLDNGGLGRLGPAGRLETLDTVDGLTHNKILALYTDQEGSLWIGTEGGGLNRLWDGKFTTYTTQEHLAHDMVLTVYEDAEGGVWIGTQGGGVSRLKDGQMTTYTTRQGLSSDVVTSLYGDRRGTLWIGTLGGGLNRLKDGRFTHYSTEDGLPSDRIFALHQHTDGTLWIGTDGGLAQLRDGRFTHYSTEDGLPSDEVSAFAEDLDGALWIGTFGGGLAQLRDGRFTRYSTEDGLPSDMVLSLHRDAQGVLWIGTYEGGLARLHRGTFTNYSTRDGLFNDKIYAILEDGNGNLWMSCNKGLFYVSKAGLNAFAAGESADVTSVSFGKADGLRTFEINGGTQPAAWKSRDGRLWFPTVQGVAMIDPAHIRWNRRPPPVTIETVLVDNQPFAPASLDTLSPGRKKFEFQYTALSFLGSEDVHFRYLLEGYDADWQDGGTSRLATYTNLPPGAYTFRVLARNHDGVWNETGASVSFYLKPFFYQTTWFYALCALALLSLAFAAYRLRIRHLKKREKELQTLVDERMKDLRAAKEKIEAQADKLRELDRFKTRFFANVSHEFRTPLTMIVGPLENALQGNYGALPDGMRRQVDIMLRNAMRLMRLINQLLDLSKLEAGKMELRARSRNAVAFLEGVVLSFTAFAEQKGITLTFQPAEPDIPLYFEPDKLEKICFNLLSNAIKFTPKQGAITVAVARRAPTPDAPEGTAEIRIRDTGVGIPQKDLPHVFDRFHQVDGSNTREHEGTGIGLSLVKELVLLHHGAIDVTSEVGRGTEFVVVLPLGNAHLKPDEVGRDDTQADAFEPEQSSLAEFAFSALGFMHEGDEASSNGHRPPQTPEAPLVLVVEDNADVREYVADILGEHYRIATAGEGREGLESARTLQPDLIVSDVMMPGMDGYALCRALKADPALDHIPVVLMTARATQQAQIEGLETGADDYLAKPFNARELVARARNLIRLRRQEKDLKILNDDLEKKVEEQVQTILRERQQYEQQLIEAKDEAEASLRLKTAILDNMNHEFRTPLTAIQGYAQLLSGELDGELREFIVHIGENGERLMKTLDAVHQLSRLEAEAFDANAEPVNLVDAVLAARGRFEEAADRKNLALRLEVPADAAIWARLDASAVERILDYLLDNAVKFTEEGEVVISAKPCGEEIVLSVRDTGIGIDPDFLPHLFEAFTQESTGLTRTHGGIGLGLTVARRLVEFIGGSISVESTKGKGSAFTVRLPASNGSSGSKPARLLQEHPAD